MPIITISRGSLSGGALLAKNLGKRLDLKVISREVIMEAAHDYAVSEAELIKGLEAPPGLWERVIGTKRDRYLLAIQATLADMIEDGQVVYHGIAGQMLLKDLPNVLKVRLIAPMDYRLRAAMEERHFTHDEAAKHIKAADEQRALWVRRLYHLEWTDPSLYDVVVNLSHMDIETATDLVIKLSESPEFVSTEDHARAVHKFALTTRVRAALAFNSPFPDEHVDVHVEQDVVHLSGGPGFRAHRNAIVAFVEKLPGVTAVAPDTEEGETVVRMGETAADVMIPLKRYPHVPQWVSIREAMMAVGASSVVLEDGHLMSPRFVLVFDEDDRLVGVVGRRNLLRGLTPHLASIERVRESVETRMSRGIDFPMPVDLQWNSLFSKAAMSASREPVKTVMDPIRGKVTSDDSLSTVVSTMIRHGIDLVPVLDGDRVVGVILMTDVFDTVAQHILEEGSGPSAG